MISLLLAALLAAPNSEGSDWSGQVAHTAEQARFVSVRGSFVVPALTAKGYLSIWLGLGGYYDTDIQQVGVDLAHNGLFQTCWVWFESYPEDVRWLSLHIKEGDELELAVTWKAEKGKVFASVVNRTSGEAVKYTLAVPEASRRSAEWIIETVPGWPLAAFGSVEWRGCEVSCERDEPLVRDAFSVSGRVAVGEWSEGGFSETFLSP